MDKENYFYSLLYHALIQKRSLAEDYRLRLEDLAKNAISSKFPLVSIETLQSYMREKNYYFTYPEFLGGVVNFSKVDKRMIKTYRKNTFRRLFYRIRRLISNKLK